MGFGQGSLGREGGRTGAIDHETLRTIGGDLKADLVLSSISGAWGGTAIGASAAVSGGAEGGAGSAANEVPGAQVAAKRGGTRKRAGVKPPPTKPLLLELGPSAPGGEQRYVRVSMGNASHLLVERVRAGDGLVLDAVELRGRR